MESQGDQPVLKRLPADAATHLAFDRTCLAHERTMMAWIRTSVSLIGFGFTIYKFFAFMIEQGKAKALEESVLGPRHLGMLMIVMGEVVLVVATLKHRDDLRQLDRRFPDQYTPPKSIAAMTACLMVVMGVLALLAVVFKQ